MNNEYSLKRVAVFLLLIVALIGIPITVYLVQREQETRSRAQVVTDDTVIAAIDGKQITRGDLRKVAEEQYEPEAVDAQALKDALDTLSERKILDKEAQAKNITIDQSEVQQKIDREGLTQTQARYEVLKEKVTLIEAKTWQVFVIGFFVPPTDQRSNLTADETSTIEKELSDGLLALSEAETLLSSGQEAVDIAKSLVSKYPSLEPVLGVNGYLLSKAEESGDLTDLTNAKVYTYQSSSIGQAFFDALYLMQNSGEVKKVLSQNDSGGNVIKLIAANPTAPFDTYEDWLASRTDATVEIVNPL